MIIRIKNMHFNTIVGINPSERTNKQKVIVNVEINFDPGNCCSTDDIKDTLDYRLVSSKIAELVENSDFNLIETLADRILQLILATPKVLSARVELDKPHAIRFAESTSIEVYGEV